jgi:hypothetical protein
MHAVNTLPLITVGFLVGWMSCLVWTLRTKKGQAMQQEVEREGRVEMGRILYEHVPSFNDVIRLTSPGFCEIFEQASLAEKTKLGQVAGVGYGKALEFLIKDYAKQETPASISEIEHASLSSCIKTYISDPAIRESAILATWLRNDETHYIRKFMDKDVQDLKGIIDLTVALIEGAERRKKIEVSIGRIGKDMRAGRA